MPATSTTHLRVARGVARPLRLTPLVVPVARDVAWPLGLTPMVMRVACGAVGCLALAPLLVAQARALRMEWKDQTLSKQSMIVIIN